MKSKTTFWLLLHKGLLTVPHLCNGLKTQEL